MVAACGMGVGAGVGETNVAGSVGVLVSLQARPKRAAATRTSDARGWPRGVFTLYPRSMLDPFGVRSGAGSTSQKSRLCSENETPFHQVECASSGPESPRQILSVF